MNHIYPDFDRIVSRKEKELRLHQKSKVIWFTGLSGSGKTTLATALERDLFNKGYLCQVLDGDNIRSGINNNLGFSNEDRIENIRRIAEISKLLINSGLICICAFVSPTEETRKIVRDIIGMDDFLEVFVSTPLEVCESRDVKGLYQKARAGMIKDFTGISAPFEMPQNAILSINTAKCGGVFRHAFRQTICRNSRLIKKPLTFGKRFFKIKTIVLIIYFFVKSIEKATI